MRLLELFKGSGSIGKAFSELGWEVVSLDIDKRSNPTYYTDILDWDHTVHQPDAFDFVWASPPCTHYSCARTNAKTPRDLEGADRIVRKTRDVIEYFGCLFACENPYTGLLRKRAVIADLAPLMRKISYCKYDAPYRKHTSVWTNLGDWWQPPPPCSKFSKCEAIAESSRHPAVAQQQPGGPGRESDPRFRQRDLFVIPQALCLEIARAATAAVRSKSE
jgi:hypothetical protein